MASIIGVETLQHTNGTTAATIDSSGRILTPARPAFKAHGTANPSAYGSGTYNTLPFNDIEYDTGGNFNTSTYKFTAPVAGLYYFQASFLVYPTNEAAFSSFYLSKNGANNYDVSFSRSQLNSQNTKHTSGFVELAVNDTIEAKVEVTTGNSLTVYMQSKHAHFEGFLVG